MIPPIIFIVIVPALILLGFNEIIPPIFIIGAARIHISDIIILVATLLIYFKLRPFYFQRVHVAIICYLLLLFVTTVTALIKFEENFFTSELVSLLRFASFVIVFFILSNFVNNTKQLIWSVKLLDLIGYICASSIYVEMILFSAGINIGQVITLGETYRFLGVLGDQVGFILLFFIIRQLLNLNLKGALFLVGALIATGTRGAILGLGASFLVIYFHYFNSSDSHRLFRKVAIFTMILGMFIVILFCYDVGGLKSRFYGSDYWKSTFIQRITTMKVAWEVFLDHPFAGVGYTGFRFLAPKYGGEGIFQLEMGSASSNFIANATNQFLQVATDGGVIALAGFLGLMVVFLQTLKRAARISKNQNTFFLAGYIWLLALLLGGQTACWMLPGSLINYLLWLILGLAAANIRITASSSIREAQMGWLANQPNHRFGMVPRAGMGFATSDH